MLTDSISIENPTLSALDKTFSSKLQQLDLTPIQKQLIQSGWTHQQAMRAINRYKMFLSIVYLNPHIPLAPTQEIDFVWHCHILHTRKYRQDCQMLFERFIDHEPETELLQYSLDTTFAQTQSLLMQYFGDAALGDTKLEEPDSISSAEHLPQQHQLDEKGYSSEVAFKQLTFSPPTSPPSLVPPAFQATTMERNSVSSLQRSACGRPRISLEHQLI